MNDLLLKTKTLLVLLCVATGSTTLAAPAKPPAVPAEIDIAVEPGTVTAGGEAQITVRLQPIAGVKINRYPRMKLSVAEKAGIVDEGEVSVGNTAPPPPDKMETNYYKSVDPLELELSVDPGAPSGLHKIPGKLSYFYCVTASGFCTKKRVDVEIPIRIE